MAEKVTTMVLKVDLQCPCCYTKIKKILAKFTEIRSHIYDEKQNTVTITVVCCSPEKIRCKLLCKGGKTIKCIEIIKEPPPKPPKSLQDEKECGQVPIMTINVVSVPILVPVPIIPVWVPAHRCPPVNPVSDCCGPCSEGNPGGSCYHGYGRQVPCYDGYWSGSGSGGCTSM